MRWNTQTSGIQMTSESTITVPTMLSRMNFSVTQTIHAQHHHHRRQLICTVNKFCIGYTRPHNPRRRGHSTPKFCDLALDLAFSHFGTVSDTCYSSKVSGVRLLHPLSRCVGIAELLLKVFTLLNALLVSVNVRPNLTVTSHLGDKPSGRQTSGRQTIRATGKWATHFGQLGDRNRNNWTMRQSCGFN